MYDFVIILIMTILSKLKDNGKIIVIEKGLFIADETAHSETTRNYVEILEQGQKTSFPLLEVDLNSDWEMYKNKYKNELKNKIDAEVYRKLNIQNSASKEDSMIASMLGTDSSYISLLRTALFEVPINFFERKKTAIDDVLKGVKSEDEKELIYNHLEKKLNIEKPSQESKKIDSKFSPSSVAELEPFADFWKKEVEKNLLAHYSAYMLIPNVGYLCLVKYADSASNNATVSVNNNKYYTYGHSNWYDHLINIYSNYFAKLVDLESSKIVEQTIKEKQKTENDYNLKREMNILSAVLQKRKNDYARSLDLDFGDYGVNLIEDRVNAYLKIPKHALRDWLWELENTPYNGQRYFVFGESKVGVTLIKDKKHSVPFFIGSAHSPFIYSGYCDGNTAVERNICMGSYQYPLPEKFSYQDIISKVLMDGKKVIMNGYTAKARPYRRLIQIQQNINDNPHLFRETTLDELKRSNIPITNT